MMAIVCMGNEGKYGLSQQNEAHCFQWQSC